MDLLNPLSRGQAQFLFQEKKFKSNCLSSDIVGNCVFVTGSLVGGLVQVETVDPFNGSIKMPVFGIIISKSSPTDCIVQIFGVVLGVGIFTPGRPLYVSSTGKLTHSVLAPTTGQVAYNQPMGIAFDTSSILLIPNYVITKRVG